MGRRNLHRFIYLIKRPLVQNTVPTSPASVCCRVGSCIGIILTLNKWPPQPAHLYFEVITPCSRDMEVFLYLILFLCSNLPWLLGITPPIHLWIHTNLLCLLHHAILFPRNPEKLMTLLSRKVIPDAVQREGEVHLKFPRNAIWFFEGLFFTLFTLIPLYSITILLLDAISIPEQDSAVSIGVFLGVDQVESLLKFDQLQMVWESKRDF